jgi:Xaa-Pro dipeptidase
MSNAQHAHIHIARQRKLSAALADHNLDALALNPGPTLTYMTGLDLHLMERPVIVFFRSHAAPVLILPEFESVKGSNLPYTVDMLTYGEDPSTWGAAFQDAVDLAGLASARIGIEPTQLRVLELRFLESAAPGAVFISAAETLASLRMIKDQREIEAMGSAVDIAQRALLKLLPHIETGRTEREIASELVSTLFQLGSEPQLPFFPIIASGPNSANPHATPTDRPLQNGDLLVIDWGATVNGYFSDITRTFAIGQVDPELARIVDITAAANAAGRAAAQPGIPAGDVDRAARAVIADADYADYFTHRTGHGLGIETHEEPYIRDDNTRLLAPGMTFTIEPGIYLPQRGGARVEDDVVITEHGCLSLTDLPRELIRIA